MPGCEVTGDGELVGFYHGEVFARRIYSLIGQSGTRYDLSIRASSVGIANTLSLFDASDAK